MSMRAATTPPRQLPEPAAPEASEQVAKRVELAELAVRKSRYCFDKDDDDLWEQARVQYKCENGPQSRDCCFDEDDLHERVPYKCKNGPALPPLSDCTYLTTATTSSTSSSSTSSTS